MAQACRPGSQCTFPPVTSASQIAALRNAGASSSPQATTAGTGSETAINVNDRTVAKERPDHAGLLSPI